MDPNLLAEMIFVFVLYSIILAACLHYYRAKKNRKNISYKVNKLRTLSPPGGSWILSNVRTVAALHKAFMSWGKRFMDHGLMHFYFGPLLVYNIWDPAYIEVVANSAHIQKKRQVYQIFFSVISEGIFSHPGGADWKDLRKPLNRSMVKNFIENKYFDVFVEKSWKMVDYIRQNEGTYYDIADDFSRIFFDTFSHTHLGIVANNLTQKRWQLNHVVDNAIPFFYDKMIEASHLYWKIFGKIGKAFLKIKVAFSRSSILENLISSGSLSGQNLNNSKEYESKGIFAKFYDELIPWLRLALPKIWRRISLVLMYITEWKNANVHLKNYTQISEWIVAERKKSKLDELDGLEYYSDFMLRRGKEKKFSRKKTLLELMDALVAGADTTPVVNATVVLFLAMHPDIQERVYREQFEIFGDSERDPTVQDLAQMELLDRVIKETLRIVCPPGVLRQAEKSERIGEYEIQKGTVIYIFAQNVHKNPKYWERPNDFYPDHFLPEKVSARPKYAYIPFGIGVRKCPGSVYAMFSLKVMLSTLLRNYKFETKMRFEQVEFDYVLMLNVKGGYPVKFVRRKKESD